LRDRVAGGIAHLEAGALDAPEHLTDRCRRRECRIGQMLDLIGDDAEAAARFARMSGFDRRVDRQQRRITRDRIDDVEDRRGAFTRGRGGDRVLFGSANLVANVRHGVEGAADLVDRDGKPRPQRLERAAHPGRRRCRAGRADGRLFDRTNGLLEVAAQRIETARDRLPLITVARDRDGEPRDDLEHVALVGVDLRAQRRGGGAQLERQSVCVHGGCRIVDGADDVRRRRLTQAAQRGAQIELAGTPRRRGDLGGVGRDAFDRRGDLRERRTLFAGHRGDFARRTRERAEFRAVLARALAARADLRKQPVKRPHRVLQRMRHLGARIDERTFDLADVARGRRGRAGEFLDLFGDDDEAVSGLPEMRRFDRCVDRKQTRLP